MTVEQAAQELLDALELLYINDFGGYQASTGESLEISEAIEVLEDVLKEKNELTETN